MSGGAVSPAGSDQEVASSAPNASLADWMAVAAGMIGALMALMDTSIINAALPVIQGEIGATPSEGTWVGTSYLVAEIVVIPLTAWLERMLGMRRLLLSMGTMFVLFSLVCATAANLETMIFGRIGQGLTGGALIPSALTIVSQRLPTRQQPVGMAMVAMTALIGPIMGPLLGGWLTENYSWHLSFTINLPIGLIQLTMIMLAIPASSTRLGELKNADWLGIFGMILSLGALTTMLEEGHRERWFESSMIWALAVATLIGCAVVAAGQYLAPRPVVQLGLFRNRTVTVSVLLMTICGMLLYGTLFLTPQFLAAIAGYNAFQAGQVIFWAGVIGIFAAFLFPLMVRKLDLRLVVCAAICNLAIGAFVAGRLTSASIGMDLLIPQLFFGVGMALTVMPLQQIVMFAVDKADAPEANGLISVARNLGGALGLAMIAAIQDHRSDTHHWQINSGIGANDPEVQRQLAETANMLGGGPEGMTAALRMFDGVVQREAFVMAFNDLFLLFGALAIISMPLVMLIRKPARSISVMSAH